MLYELLAQHADLVRDVTIERFRTIETAHELRASLTLVDGSVLHVRDYVFQDGTRKYAYHWQSRQGRLRRRWDNSGHWPDLPSHPHHVHVRSAARVLPSSVRDLAGALRFIAQAIHSAPTAKPRRRR